MDSQRLLFALFGCFLIWRFMAVVLYVVRAIVCCVEERKPSFLCGNFTVYEDSLELEMAWLTSHILSQVISLLVVAKSSVFLGYSVLFKKLIRLPNYLSLVFLWFLSIIGYITILALHHKGKALQEVSLVAFMIKSTLSVLLVGLLNFTQLKQLTRHSKVFSVLCKMTVFMFFVDNACNAAVGSIQFAFKVNGLDHSKHSITAEFHILFSVLRRFTLLVYYYRLAHFYWQKLFMDRNNLLSYYQKIGESDSELQASLGRGNYQAIL